MNVIKGTTSYFLSHLNNFLFSPKVKMKGTASFLGRSHNITSKRHVLASNLSSVLSLHLSSLHLFSVFASLILASLSLSWCSSLTSACSCITPVRSVHHLLLVCSGTNHLQSPLCGTASKETYFTI